ncbi:MAG: hypothetical protein QM756_28165 [Polyangiaceae bacterium]
MILQRGQVEGGEEPFAAAHQVLVLHLGVEALAAAGARAGEREQGAPFVPQVFGSGAAVGELGAQHRDHFLELFVELTAFADLVDDRVERELEGVALAFELVAQTFDHRQGHFTARFADA